MLSSNFIEVRYKSWMVIHGCIRTHPKDKGKKMGLYMSQAKVIKREVSAIEDCSADLWHKRLGHLSEKGLGILAKKNYLPLKGMNLNTCTHCLSGKQYRVAFQRSSSHRRSHILDLVHTDILLYD